MAGADSETSKKQQHSSDMRLSHCHMVGTSKSESSTDQDAWMNQLHHVQANSLLPHNLLLRLGISSQEVRAQLNLLAHFK